MTSLQTGFHTSHGPPLSVAVQSRVAVRLLAIGALAVGGAYLLFFNLANYRSLASHEVFVAVPAGEMLRTGDWVLPMFGGIPRLKKPPLAYWSAASSSWLLGDVSHLSLRIPSAIAALLLALLMGVWARRWYGTTAGYAAGIVQLTSVWALLFGRKAEIDMQLCLVTTAAMFLVASAPERESPLHSFWRWTGFYSLVSLAWLSKWHYGPAMVLAPVGVFLVLQYGRSALRKLANPLGLMLLAAAVIVWPLLILQQVPDVWELWQIETVGRAVGEKGSAPFWYYVPHLLLFTMPWTPFAAWAVRRSWRRAWSERDAREKFLWIWILAQAAVLFASANKHKHYLLAMMPAFTLLAVQGLTAVRERHRRGEPLLTARWARLHTLLCPLLATAAGLIVHRMVPHEPWLGVAIGGTLAVSGPIAIRLFRRDRPRPACLALAAAFVALFTLFQGWVVPARDHRLHAAEFARGIRSDLPGREIGVYNMDKSALLYYLRHPVYRIESEDDLVEELAARKRLLLIVEEPSLDDIEKCGDFRIVRKLKPLDRLPKPQHAPLMLIELRPTG